MVASGPMRAAKATAIGRLGAADWERAVLEAIAEGGLEAISIEALARALGVTKGSFYWHFENREALLDAALRRWRKQSTEDVIAGLAAVRSPLERLRALIARALEEPVHGRLEIAFVAAASHPLVGPVLRRVAAARLRFVAGVFEDLGLAREQARRRALLVYAAFVGLFQLTRAVPRLTGGDALDELIDTFLDALGSTGRARARRGPGRGRGARDSRGRGAGRSIR